jgi:hypothetical protein
MMPRLQAFQESSPAIRLEIAHNSHSIVAVRRQIQAYLSYAPLHMKGEFEKPKQQEEKRTTYDGSDTVCRGLSLCFC